MEKLEIVGEYTLVDELKAQRDLSEDKIKWLLMTEDMEIREYLFRSACQIKEKFYGKSVFLRGLIEFSNYCRNNCYYCGIRRDNMHVKRFRMTKKQILALIRSGYQRGFRTFVLQGGEDPFFTKEGVGDIVCAIKHVFPDCAVTLSIGEQEPETYQYWRSCGADRYLLRHETADARHYQELHPPQMRLEERIKCLYALKDAGFQVGAGLMVGSPGQTIDCLIADLRFLQELEPHMIGIGPFIPHKDTPFASCSNGSVEMTLRLLAVLRLMHPDVLLPATTALGTLDPDGKRKGLLAGANVLMPNLTPVDESQKYMLYNRMEINTIYEDAYLDQLEQSIHAIGYVLDYGRGDSCRVGLEKTAADRY